MKVALCLAGVLLLLFTVEATSKHRKFISRQRRSLNWLPTFLGGSKISDTEDVTEALSSASDEPAIEPDVGNKRVNGQLYYPIWRVHSYDGVHFQPIPLSFVQNAPLVHQPTTPTENRLLSKKQQTFNQPINVPEIQTFLNNGVSGNIQDVQPNEYPQELVDLAREYGFIDISRFPSLEKIGNLLGTATQEETIETIKDLVSTQEGRDLIQQYIANGEDNEVAASEVDKNVEKAEAEAAEPVDYDEVKPAETNLFGNYVLHNGFPQHSFLTQNPLFGQLPPQREQYGTKNVNKIETTTPATSYSDRIVQWANFLNPATNRQEIPIPISDLESNKDLNYVNQSSALNVVRQIPTSSVNSNSWSPLQNIPGIPAMPNIYNLRYPNAQLHVGSENGQYVLVKVPLAGFNRSPLQQQIDPKYIQYASNQRQLGSLTEDKPLSGHMPSAQSATLTDPVNRKSIQVHHRVATTTNRDPVQNVVQLPTKPAKQTHWNPVGSSRTTSNNIPQGLQLPLIDGANYEVFRNAPWLETSYGTPASPYSIEGLNAIHVSPESSAAFIHQEYDLRPAASETVERKLSSTNTQIVSNDQMSGNEDVTNKQDITSRNQETVEPSINEQESVQVESHKNDSNAYENKADVDTEDASTEKSAQGTSMSTEKNIRNDLNGLTVNNDKKTRNSHIQRITPHDKPATGKIYRADPKAMEMLPFTVRRMATAQKKTNDK